MSFGDEMKSKAEEVHLREKAKDFGDALGEMARTAMELAAGYAQQNRDKVDGVLDKTGRSFDEKTGGKYSDTVYKVRAQVDKGLDKLVETRGQGTGTTPGTGTTGAGTTADAGTTGTAAGTSSTTASPRPEAPAPPPPGSPAASDRTRTFDDDEPADHPS